MKKLKLNLQHLANAEVLTKSQSKNVLGRSAPVTTGRGSSCPSDSCSLFDPNTGHTYPGHCGFSNPGAICECITDYGVYLPPGGQSHCVAP